MKLRYPYWKAREGHWFSRKDEQEEMLGTQEVGDVHKGSHEKRLKAESGRRK